ncbi:MAG: cadmium-translocating P-type ATPase [Planctomycetes bacterium]|nr:cadmium-translocating P-type ATPase [Planctomycetota bacterium]
METARVTFELSGIDCPTCAGKVEQAVQRLDGVVDVQVDFLASTLSLEYYPERTTPQHVAELVAGLGYRVGDRAAVSGQAVYHIAEMDCADELRVIEAALHRTGAVRHMAANFVARTLSVEFDPDAANAETLRQAIASAGFPASIEGDVAPARPAWATAHRKWLLVGLSAACFAAALMIHAGRLLHGWSLRPLATFGDDRPVTTATLLFAAAMIAGGYPIARSALRALRLRTFDMNLLMTVAAVGAAFLWEWAEAASAMLLFSLALQLEGYTMGRARRAVEKLMRLAPTRARLRRDGALVEVPAEQVQPGEVAVVRPGETIPTDGVIVEGRSDVNQAPVTGESRPVSKDPGDEVFAGSINGDGVVEVRATKAYADTTLARMLHLVEEAQSSRAPSQQLVERFARWYTPAVIVAAMIVATLPPLALGASWRSWFFRALVMLVIACPCALVISTPVTIIAALASAARRGILIKGGLHVENLGRVRTFLFDKTGTLTRGQFAVDEAAAMNGATEDDVLRTAGAVEAHSEHVLASAIRRHLRQHSLTIAEGRDARAIPGRGAMALVDDQACYVGSGRLMEELGILDDRGTELLERLEGSGRTAVLVARGRTLLGGIAMTDCVRDEAPAMVHRLRQLGAADLVMLTGDNPATAATVGGKIGMDHIHAQLSPEEKVEKVLFLTRRDGATAMVGDGVNDSPALAAATVGIAMGAAGTDVALETADVALMTDRLDHVPEAVELGRRTLSVIRQNMTVALGLKAVFFALALADMATLWMAVVADMGASLLVIANGLRLLRPARHAHGRSTEGP